MTSVTLPFPHPKLTLIQGKPTNSSIKILKKEVYSNAWAIPSQRGRGKHGHLGLVMENYAYTTVTAKAWDLPEHPGPYPKPPDGESSRVIDKHVRRYKVLIAELTLSKQVVNELRQLILVAVPPFTSKSWKMMSGAWVMSPSKTSSNIWKKSMERSVGRI